jgi:hypothetical protein
MKLKLPRRRWLLLYLMAVAIAAIGLLQLWVQSRFTREQYDQIQLGMTPNEVRTVMGCGPTGARSGEWELVDYDIPIYDDFHVGEKHDVPAHVFEEQAWTDNSIRIVVHYCDSKAISKAIRRRRPGWKIWWRQFVDWISRR